VLGINQVCNKLRASLEVTPTVGWLPQIDGFNWDSGFTLRTTFTGRHHRVGVLSYADANDDDDTCNMTLSSLFASTTKTEAPISSETLAAQLH